MLNPDKLHHYLNAGLEVIASPIPAARRLERHLHLMTTGGDWGAVLRDLRTSRRQDSWPREAYTCDRRWAELVNLVLPDEAVTPTPQGVRPSPRRSIAGTRLGALEVVVHDFAQTERQVSQIVAGRDNSARR